MAEQKVIKKFLAGYGVMDVLSELEFITVLDKNYSQDVKKY